MSLHMSGVVLWSCNRPRKTSKSCTTHRTGCALARRAACPATVVFSRVCVCSWRILLLEVRALARTQALRDGR